MSRNIRFNPHLRKTALSLSLALCFTATVQVQAQNITGSIYGSTESGGTITVQNMDTGARQSITVDSSGRYQISTLPAGRYRITLERDGNTIASKDNIQVLVGRGTEVFLGSAASSSNLDSVVVRGQGMHQIDTTQIESKMVITKQELDNMPVGRDITAIAMLAPGVVEGDSRYPRAPTISGSSASENAYYINGFPVTNPLTNVGYTQLPFNGVAQAQVSTGGYGVEYGRATGGVVNIITSRGSNDWAAGGRIIWRPESLYANPRNLYYGPNGRSGLTWGNAGQIYRYRNDDTFSSLTTSAYVGGPIIKDRLFFYAAGEFAATKTGLVRTTASSQKNVNTAASSGWRKRVDRVPRWLAKVDWHINDDHALELTGFSDRQKLSDHYSGFDYHHFSRTGGFGGGEYSDEKTTTYVANYTGYLSDNLTLTAMYGRSKHEQPNELQGYRPDCPRIDIAAGAQVPGLDYTTCQTYSSVRAPHLDRVTAWRIDLEYRLGNHTLRAGYDLNKANTDNATNIAGGYAWSFARLDDPNEPIYPQQGVASPASGGGYGLDGYYVSRVYNSLASRSRLEQKAQYIKDMWQVSDNVLVEIGVRNEQFTNFNSANQPFLKKSTQIAPRFGITWDVKGDSSTKLFAYAGRYHLAIPNYIARRMADGAINTNEAFVYTGIDPKTGAPTGLNALGPVYSANNEFGQPKDPNTIAPTSLKSHAQDLFALGWEQRLNAFNVGAKFSYANLVSAIDDFCDGRQAQRWAIRNGYSADEVARIEKHFHGCVMLNPGRDNTYLFDINQDGRYETIHLTREELGFPRLKRRYYALDAFIERPFDGNWYARLDYTFSKNWGNMEGQLNSDLGQADVSSTVTSDYPELSEHASGYLPNHRRHQLKLYGYYQFAQDWMISGNLVYMSGRPRNCMGGYPYTTDSPNYGSYHFYCNGVPSPRGTFGKLPSTLRFDLGLRYSPSWAPGVSLGMDVYNLFNRQVATSVEERYNQGASLTTLRDVWGRTISYSTPRYVEFSIRYDWGAKKD